VAQGKLDRENLGKKVLLPKLMFINFVTGGARRGTFRIPCATRATLAP
jgi:hypothetical protein